MNEYIKSITASSYTGEFEHSGSQMVVSGTFGTDVNKKITSFVGKVMKEDIRICNFSCNPWTSPITFNYTEVTDPEALVEAIEVIGDTYEGVVSELEGLD